jgi:hypothetical protein
MRTFPMEFCNNNRYNNSIARFFAFFKTEIKKGMTNHDGSASKCKAHG